MPLRSAAKSYRPMAGRSTQPTATNLVPSKQKCLGATPPGIYKSRKRRPPYSRYNIRKRRFHLASYPNNFSLANQTNKSILPLRQLCWLAKRKARAGLHGPCDRQARRTAKNTKRGRRKPNSPRRLRTSNSRTRRHWRRRHQNSCPDAMNAPTKICHWRWRSFSRCYSSPCP